MRIDILQHAANELRALEAELIEKDKLDLFYMDVFIKDTECGTTACFIGWAGIRGWFEQWGMKIRFEPKWIGSTFKVPVYCIEGQAHHFDHGVLSRFLGLTDDSTIGQLIGPGDYEELEGKIMPSTVADRIEHLIRVGEHRFLIDMRCRDSD